MVLSPAANAAIVMLWHVYWMVPPAPRLIVVEVPSGLVINSLPPPSAGEPDPCALHPVSPDPSASFKPGGCFPAASTHVAIGFVSLRTARAKRSASNDCSIP